MSNKRMEDWLNLINAETEGDLQELEASTDIPEVKQAIAIVRELSADESVWEEVRQREAELREEARVKAAEMRKQGYTEEQIKERLGEYYSEGENENGTV